MEKFIAIFKDGFEIVKTLDEIKNRLDFYNWICMNKISVIHGPVIAIEIHILY